MKHDHIRFTFRKSSKRITKSKAKCSRYLSELFATPEYFQRQQEYEVELMGLLDMVEGLEYHHKKFVRMENIQRKILQKIFDEEELLPTPPQNMIHESVAYLNRLGQIDALITSEWFKRQIGETELANLCPIILSLMPLRNKFAAHRSIDYRRDETNSQLINHASVPLGLKWTSFSVSDDVHEYSVVYRIKIYCKDRHKILRACERPPIDKIEIFGNDEIWIFFILSKQHAYICAEIIKIVEAFFVK